MTPSDSHVRALCSRPPPRAPCPVPRGGETWRRSVAAAAVATLVGCGGPRVPVVKVGFVAPLTGDQAAQGMDLRRGAELAVQDAVREGEVLAGHRIELVALDDQRNPAQAVIAAKKLASDPDVLAVVGHLNSSCTKPASAIYHEARLLQVSPISSNPEISRQGFDTFYRICPTDDLQGPAAARFAAGTLGVGRVFLLDDLTTYGRGLANEFERAATGLGLELLGHEGITQGDKDFTPILSRIKARDPDLLYFAGMFPEGALLIKQAHDLGLRAVFMGGDGLFEQALIELATPEAAEGAYVSSLGGDIRAVPTAEAFVRTYEAAYGPIGAYSAYAYEATRLALQVIRRAGRPDRDAVVAAMAALGEYPGILGTHTFDERGDTRIRTIGFFVVRDGRFVFVTAATPDAVETARP